MSSNISRNVTSIRRRVAPGSVTKAAHEVSTILRQRRRIRRLSGKRHPYGDADEKVAAPLNQRGRDVAERAPEHDFEPQHRCANP